MNVIELYRLTNWVNEEIVNEKLPQKYSQLHSVLQQNTQANQPKAAFETQKNDLIKAISDIELMKLTKDQLSFLDELGILSAFGQHGVEQIENILFRNSLDIATAAQNIQGIMGKLNEGIRKIKLISDGLEGCIHDDSDEDIDEVLIRVSFLGDAEISNVKDFKEWGAQWHDIGRGIAMACNATPEDIKIIGAAKGSVILELLTNPQIATTIGGIIWGSLKVAEKVLDIRKKASEIRQIDLTNKQLEKNASDLEKTAGAEKETGIKNIIALQVKELSLKKNGDGEKITALEKSITNLVDFIEKGGEVDFVVPEEENAEEESSDESCYTRIREQAQEIRSLEDKLKLLEHNNTEE